MTEVNEQEIATEDQTLVIEDSNQDENLNEEIESLTKIKKSMNVNDDFIWRFATGIGEQEDREVLEEGWILEEG